MTDKLMNKLRIIGREAAEKQLFIIWKEVGEGKTDYRDTQAHTLTENAFKTYIEGDYNPLKGKVGGLRLGEDFIPSRAAAHIINTLPDVKDVHIIHPTSIIPIHYYQKAVPGEIHIEIH